MKRRAFLSVAVASFLSATMVGCSEPQVEVPDVKPAIEAYLQNLKAGDKAQLIQTYFMPLSWRKKEKVYQAFDEQHQAIQQGRLTLTLLDFKQKGRWAVASIEKRQTAKEGKETTEIEPTWFFYYDGRWQYISPHIYKSGMVRNMMDLYREQEALQKWAYERQQGFSHRKGTDSP